METKNQVLLTILILIALGAVFYFTTYAITKYTGYHFFGLSPEVETEKVVDCLNEHKAILYYTGNSERAIFGIFFNKLNAINCGTNRPECMALKHLPAWKIDDKIYYGSRSIQELKEITKCKV